MELTFKMETKLNQFKDITWNPEDLESAKQGLIICLRNGMNENEIVNYDFGNLAVGMVLEELGY